MGVFNAINDATEKAISSGETYVKTTQEYFKLKVFQQVTLSFSYLSKMAIIGGLMFLGLVFLTVSGALYLGEILNSLPLACLLMALLLFALALIAYYLRGKLDRKIIRKISSKFFD